MMPQVSPCGRVVDFLRSCARGYWRFYPDRPDLLTPGYHYFSPEGTHTINAPHSFGSAVWLKDGMTYPEYPTGQLMRAGTQWYNGQAPAPLPPDQQIFDDGAFSEDLTFPPAERVPFANGFDERCFVVHHPGVDIDVDPFLKPDITDCCWQRVLARLLELLVGENPGDLATFHAAVALMWPGFTVQIFFAASPVDRFAWINGPDWQLVLRLGTQSWAEIFSQVFSTIQPPRNFGAFSTSAEWFALSTEQATALEVFGWDPDKPVIFAGHSRGGVVQWILARRMMEANPARSIECLTFGVPKPGDVRLVELGGITRARHVIHRQDVIPLLPPGRIAFPFLQATLDWLDVNPWVAWAPFPVYQITGDGWGNGMEPGRDVPVDTIITWLRRLRLGLEVDPIAQHFLASYTAALADCCDAVQFPFTDQFWQTLFGAADNAFGGMMIDGVGELAGRRGSSGLAIGGGSSPRIGTGGLEIGGAGIATYTPGHFIILENGYLILLESGGRIELE